MTTVSEVVKRVPVFRLHFRKDPAFWRVVDAAVDGFPDAGGIQA